MTGLSFAVKDGSRAFRGKLSAISTLVDFLGESDTKESVSWNSVQHYDTSGESVRAIHVVQDMLDGEFRWVE